MVVDPVLLILSLIVVVLLVFGNIYFLAYYSHYADTMFGQSIPAKLVLVSDLSRFYFFRCWAIFSLSVRC